MLDDKDNAVDKAYSAFCELMEMITPIPELDDEKELAEYRDDKYEAYLELRKMRKKAPDDFDYDEELGKYRDERYGKGITS